MPEHPDPNHVLTWRQRKVLQVIRDSVQRRGYPPSMREIGEAVGLSSSSTVHSHLAALEAKGFLRRDPSKPRALEGARDVALEFRSFDIDPQFRDVWDRFDLWRFRSVVAEPVERAYSMANYPSEKGILLFTITFAVNLTADLVIRGVRRR